MKLFYFTSKCYPSLAPDDIYALHLADAMSKFFENFTFFVSKFDSEKPKYIKTDFGFARFRFFYSFFYIFYLLIFYKNIVFFSNDINLLKIFIFYKKFFQFKLVVDWHMLFTEKENLNILQNADLNITTSKKLAEKLLKIGDKINRKVKVETVYGGVKLNYFKDITISREDIKIPEDKKIISYVGGFKTLGKEKGLKTIIDSLKFLPEEFLCLLVGGKKDEIEEYKNYVKKQNLQNRVFLIGRVLNEEIHNYMSLSDYLIIPYPDEPHFRDFGFPMKVYEYMASGKPIIYSKLDLVEEIVADCALGFVPENPLDLAEKIIYLNKNEIIKKRMTQKSLEKVRFLDWKEKAKKIHDIILANLI